MLFQGHGGDIFPFVPSCFPLDANPRHGILYAFHFVGSDCILCHTNPQDGSLNETGILFQERGYRYPLVWKQVCYYLVIGSVFLYILSCIRRRYRLWHTGMYENRWNQMIERGKGVLLYGFAHRTILRNPFPGKPILPFEISNGKETPGDLNQIMRMGWMKELGVREVSPGESVDILFWVGCYGSYDDRNIKVATHLIKILKKAGLDFGVLGSAEWCCGIDLRRMGSEYLFQVNVKRNMDCLLQVTFQKTLTACPHCFNTLKNEYRQFGARFEVVHSSHLVDQLIQQGKVVIAPVSLLR